MGPLPQPATAEPMAAPAAEPVLEVEGMRTVFRAADREIVAVDGVSLSLDRGEIVAIVGESGSGKSVLMQSVLGLVRGEPGVVDGQVTLRIRDEVIRPFEGRPAKPGSRFRARVEKRFRGVRGTGVGLVLQNGRAALDPFWTVGRQLQAALRQSGGDAGEAAVNGWLSRLGFDHPEIVARAHPHELSGGMAQRAMLGVVLARAPEILFLDEITTGLDVSLQASVLKLLRRLHAQVGFSAVLVTHDLGIARGISQRTVIMKGGRVVQAEDTEALFQRRVPLDPYTEELLAQGQVAAMERTDLIEDLHLDAADDRAPLVSAAGVDKRFGGRGLFRKAPDTRALAQASIRIAPGEAIALVGESGSGKTTLSRILVGLLRPDGGQVAFDGQDVFRLDARGAEGFRRRRTLLFQNPYTSLNPEMTAEEVVAEALVLYRDISPDVARRGAHDLLESLGLGERARARLGGLSGGERRRVGLLRAMQSDADLIVLDEPTAGLDAVHRRDVAQMIWKCRGHRPTRSMVIVSHDLGFVSRVADRIVVLYRGSVVETVGVNDFVNHVTVHHPYTQLLWDASRYVGGVQSEMTQIPARRADLFDVSPLPLNAGGCLYRARCPIYQAAPDRWSRCERDEPKLVRLSKRVEIACHGVADDNPS